MSKTNIGLMIGKFAPLTTGHISAITRAAMRCHKLKVVVCIDHAHDPELPMTSEQRINVVRETFKGHDNIIVETVDCTAFPYAKEDDVEVSKYWAKWIADKHPDVTELFGSEQYVEYMAHHYPGCLGIRYTILDINRQVVDISATRVRNEPYKCFNYIAPAAKKYYTKHILVIGSESCVPPETEYFNGKEWKPISQYIESDLVLQYTESGCAQLVEPLNYIKVPAGKMYQFSNSYGNWTQTLCPDHEHVLLTSRGNLVKKKVSDLVDSHFNNKNGITQKLITGFYLNGQCVNYQTPEEIRLAVAISADGTLARKKWRIRLIKKSKINRFRALVESSKYELDERIYSDGSHNFYLPKEAGTKELPMSWVFCSYEDKVEFIDELQYWDSHISKSGIEYFTTLKHNADVVMTVAASMCLKVNTYKDVRDERATCYKLSIPKTTSSRSLSINKHNEKYRQSMVKEVESSDGFKYCFTVPSGMLVLREKDHIFITGNCGKTTLVNNLGNLLNAPTVPEMYRSMFPGKGSEFTPTDLYHVAVTQNKAANLAVASPDNKGVIIHDTCNDVTAEYGRLYYPSDVHVQELIKEEKEARAPKFHLVLFCDTTNIQWENDGTRDQGDEANRQDQRNRFYSLAIQKAKENNCKMVELLPDYKRLPEALNEINKVIYGLQ